MIIMKLKWFVDWLGLKRCHTCRCVLLFSRKKYGGVYKGVGFVDGRDVEYCAKCSFGVVNKVFGSLAEEGSE